MPQSRSPVKPLPPEKVRELKKLAEKIDREEGEEIKAKGRAYLRDAFRLQEVFRELQIERRRQDLSLTEIARRSGIDRARLSRLEAAKHPNVTTETLHRYARVLNKRIVLSLADASSE